MSLHISVVAIQGNHLDNAEQLLGLFGYESGAGPIEATEWGAVGRHLDDHNSKVVYCHGGWTAIVDPELVLMLDEQACAEVSRRLGSQVCGLVCEGVSGTYGFHLFRGGEKVRGFCSSDGKITEDVGEPLDEETDVDRNRASEASLLDLVARIGFDYWSLEEANRFLVYYPKRADSGPASTVGLPSGDEKKGTRRPWWRLW